MPRTAESEASQAHYKAARRALVDYFSHRAIQWGRRIPGEVVAGSTGSPALDLMQEWGRWSQQSQMTRNNYSPLSADEMQRMQSMLAQMGMQNMQPAYQLPQGLTRPIPQPGVGAQMHPFQMLMPPMPPQAEPPAIEELPAMETLPCSFCGGNHFQSKCTKYINAKKATAKEKEEQARLRREKAAAKKAAPAGDDE